MRIPGFLKRAVSGLEKILGGLPIKVHFNNQTGHKLAANVSLKAEGNAVGVWVTVYEKGDGFTRRGVEAEG